MDILVLRNDDDDDDDDEAVVCFAAVNATSVENACTREVVKRMMVVTMVFGNSNRRQSILIT